MTTITRSLALSARDQIMRDEPLPIEDDDDDPIENRRRQRRRRFLLKLSVCFAICVVGVAGLATIAVNRRRPEPPAITRAEPRPQPGPKPPALQQTVLAPKPSPWREETVRPSKVAVQAPEGVDHALPPRQFPDLPPEVEEPKKGGPIKPLKEIDLAPDAPVAFDPPPMPAPKLDQPGPDQKSPDRAGPPPARPVRGGVNEVVIAEGVGKDEMEAKKAAYRDAVSRVVGTLVDAETLVKNDEVISEKILEFSGGFVKTYEVLKNEKTPDGLVRIKIKATVERLTIATRLADAKVATKEVRGEDLLAEKMTKEEAKKNATELLAKLYSDLPKLMKAEVKGQPKLTDTRDGVYIDLALSVDMKGYEAFVKKAVVVLDKIALAKDSVLVGGEPLVTASGVQGVRYSSKVQFAGLPVLGQNTPKGYAVWLLTQIDRLGTQMRWNLYWVDADVAKCVEPLSGEVRLHTKLLNGDGQLLTEEELPLFLTDCLQNGYSGVHRGTKEWGFKSGYWMLWGHSPREYSVDSEKRETISLFIAPLVTQLNAGFGPQTFFPGTASGNQGEYMPSATLRRKIKLTDDDLGRLKQVNASIEFHAAEFGKNKR